MRTIVKRSEPSSLAEYRSREGADFEGYGDIPCPPAGGPLRTGAIQMEPEA